MAVATKSRLVVEPIKVTKTAYDLASQLFAMGAATKAVPVTKEMLAQKLTELTGKQIAKRQGQTAGRFGKSGTVQLLVEPDALMPIPDRRPRRKSEDQSVASSTGLAPTTVLTLTDLEAFVARLRETLGPLRDERSSSIQSRIAELQQHLARAKGDDFRNTMAMANAELKKLDEIEASVIQDALDAINPGPQSALAPVWRAMRHRS